MFRPNHQVAHPFPAQNWSVPGKLPACYILDRTTRDFFDVERRLQGRTPGPFRDVPTKPAPVSLRQTAP